MIYRVLQYINIKIL